MSEPAARDLFASAVPYYARYRSGYPEAEVAALAARTGLAGSDAVDVGCGSGQLTIPLARHARHVLAVDPVEGMLDEGRAAARAAGVDNVTWVHGDSTRLRSLVVSPVRVATFAASFHWTDRAGVLAALDEVLLPGGCVVVLDDDLGDDEQPDWADAIGEVRARYPGLEPLPGALNRPLDESHTDVLRRSAFSDVRTSTWSWTRRLTVDEVVGLQLTYSFSTPALLGDRVDRYREEVRERVLALYPDGVVTEPYRVAVHVATRPGA